MTIINEVNHLSNQKLISNLEFSIADISPRGAYHLDIPDSLVESIAAIRERLESYQSQSNIHNRPTQIVITPESVSVLSDGELKEKTQMIFEWLYDTDNIKDKNRLLELLDVVHDELNTRFCLAKGGA
ncbi:hypothetical protein [Bacillus sp. KH172YL63]|uniref:hypothetical protein n=1 Tax=Bacillus sp. KH172YL63 TaxID=2709784 RepID=UPI0013E4C1AA|nr:hypothetical protein [Bacillus sp. KH172YL63]BCB03506.1 hypothetical protein KH172YL63_16390 [Bacillus sp. KH172YL63]